MGWELGVPTHTGREPDARVQARLPKHLSPGCSGRAECHISPGYRTPRRSAGPECAPRWLGAGCQRGQAAVTELHGQPVGMAGPDRDSLGIGSAWWRQPLRCCRSVCPVGSSSPHGPRPACPAGTFSRTSNLSGLSQCETCPAGLACPPGEWGGGKAASLPGVRSQLHAEVWRPGTQPLCPYREHGSPLLRCPRTGGPTKTAAVPTCHLSGWLWATADPNAPPDAQPSHVPDAWLA